MTKVFLDTDIILDFLANRKPFSGAALVLFLKAHNREISLFTTSNSITTAYYILCKYTTENKAKHLISDMLSYFNIIPVSGVTLESAFKSSFKDVEDAVQFYSALTIPEIQCIITRNIKDYKKSSIPVMSSDDFVKKH